MTWTREHDRLIAERICGYEVDVSPRGAYFIREKGNPWRALPNFQVDAFETASTLDASVRGTSVSGSDRQPGARKTRSLRRPQRRHCGARPVAYPRIGAGAVPGR